MKKVFFTLTIFIFLSISASAQTCIGSSQLKTEPGVFQWMEASGDNRLYCGGVHYATFYAFDGDTIFAPPGAYATCYVVVTDTAFNLIRMFNQVSFFRAGGAFNDLRIWNMALDVQQNVLFTGSYTDSMLVYGTDTVLSDRYQEGFLSKCDSVGQPTMLRSFGSRSLSGNYSFEDRGHCVTTDPAGNIYVGGSFEGDYFRINSDTVNNGTFVGLNSYKQGVVFSLTPTGQTRWLKAFGTRTQDDTPFGIAADSAGNVTICGSSTASNQDFQFGSIVYHYKPSPNGFQGFAGGLDSSGNAIWFYPMETYVGSGPDVSAYDAVFDATGNSYIAGFFDGYAVFNNDTIKTLNYTSSYLLKINPAGQQVFLKTGNIDTFYPYPIALKLKGDKVFLTGQSFTNRLIFEPYGLCCSREVFFTMYDTSGTVLWLKGISASGGVNVAGYDVNFTASGNGLACGGFSGGTITIEPNTATTGGTEYYLVRFGDVASNGLTMSLANNGSDTIVCGAVPQLQMTVNPTANTRFFWSADNDTIPGPFYAATLNATPKFTTTYYAVAYNNSCTVLDSITVYVTPIVVNAGSDTAVCAGAAFQLNGNVITNALYAWTPSSVVSDDSIPDPVASITSNQQLIYTIDMNGCINSDTLNVAAINSPVAGFVLSSTNLQINLTNQSQGLVNFRWTFGDGGVDSLNTDPVYTYSASGTYTVCLEVYNECGTDSVCQTVTITNVGIDEVNAGIVVKENSDEIVITYKSGDAMQVRLIDLSGKIIFTRQFNANEIHLSKSEFPAGIYILSAGNSEAVIQKRILIVK